MPTADAGGGALAIGEGNVLVILARPVTASLLLIAALLVLWPVVTAAARAIATRALRSRSLG